MLKQEEMKTWKKIEETKKRTNDITGLKKRNEERVQKVSYTIILIIHSNLNILLIENIRYSTRERAEKVNELK